MEVKCGVVGSRYVLFGSRVWRHWQQIRLLHYIIGEQQQLTSLVFASPGRAARFLSHLTKSSEKFPVHG